MKYSYCANLAKCILCYVVIIENSKTKFFCDVTFKNALHDLVKFIIYKH